jgi:RNA polymerase sigma factor (sigma-70 family)
VDIQQETVWLLKQLRSGECMDDEAIRERIIELHRGIIAFELARITKGWKNFLERLDDLKSAGMLGLCHAINKYDLESPYKFCTYACASVRGFILKSLGDDFLMPVKSHMVGAYLAAARGESFYWDRYKQEMRVVPDSIKALVAGVEWFEGYWDKEEMPINFKTHQDTEFEDEVILHQAIRRSYQHLKTSYQKVLYLRYLRQLPYKSIASIMGMTESGAFQAVEKAKKKLLMGLEV